ncbi:Tumor necrosis factor receptor superfamily member 5 [Merluccius polli]|uniref:Tumor necrosis factor receptor superfamily member 5 n=1 Tax=Merluccius polli TaxID=89951 RepID=A0AA47MZR3_MERPO|nr:Tumor necrosis factor receptor superfamily member 5 [Merluccius polli]
MCAKGKQRKCVFKAGHLWDVGQAQPLYFPFICLSILLFPFCVDSLDCNREKEYAWPIDNSQRCCEKCPPGQYLYGRCQPDISSKSECKPCPAGQYTEDYNVELSCPFCFSCNPDCEFTLRLEDQSSCKTNQNTVCRCQQGFTCTSQPCQQCEPTPYSTTHTPLNTTIDNKEWLVLFGGSLIATGLLLLMFICIFLHIKIKSGAFLCRSTRNYAIESAEKETEFLPVQEMCGKHEQQQPGRAGVRTFQSQKKGEMGEKGERLKSFQDLSVPLLGHVTEAGGDVNPATDVHVHLHGFLLDLTVQLRQVLREEHGSKSYPPSLLLAGMVEVKDPARNNIHNINIHNNNNNIHNSTIRTVHMQLMSELSLLGEELRDTAPLASCLPQPPETRLVTGEGVFTAKSLEHKHLVPIHKRSTSN